jgi:penicillin-binding protein 1A
MRITKRRVLILVALLAVVPPLLLYPYYGHSPCPVSTRVQGLRNGTELLDAAGKRLSFTDPTREQYIALSVLPSYVAKAFVAVEDRRLHSWYHRGIDPLGTVAAAVGNVLPGDRPRRGASTIPMQLSRALCGDRMPNDHSWSGKLAEAGLSLYVTAKYGKTRVVEMYLNSVYLGRNRSGVAAAARSYYGKAPQSLTLADAAELAHLVANPRDRDPSQRSPADRRSAIQSVVERIRRNDPAFASPTKRRVTPSRTRMAAATPMVYRGYISRVRDGFSRCVPSIDCPASVRTFLDAGLQRAAERELTALVQRLQGRTRARSKSDTTPPREVAGIFVAMRVSTGEVVSYTGRHGRTVAGADLLRIGRIQPASTLKPLLLAAAMDDGSVDPYMSLGDLSRSHCPDAKVQTYLATLSGFDAPDRSIAESMFRSDNVLGACLMAGLSPAARQRLVTAGVLRSPEAEPADGLGLQTVAPLDLLAAYSALRTGDRPLLPRFSGYDAAGTGSRLVSPQSAEATYTLLQGVVQQGTAWRAASVLNDDYALAGKTGTAGGGRELLFIGFARDLVALIWVGVVSGNGAVSSQHAADVVVAPWARILRGYEQPGFQMIEQEQESASSDEMPDAQQVEAMRRWMARTIARIERRVM